MEFENQTPACKFSIPDRPTVKQQLLYIGAAAGGNRENLMLRLWEGAQQLITRWECAVLPDYKIDLETVSDPSQVEVVIWAALRVRDHMNALEDLPKNS